MTTTSLAASDQGAAVGMDRLFFGLALTATAILVALVRLDHHPTSAALIIGSKNGLLRVFTTSAIL